MIRETIGIGLLAVGVGFMLIASLGVARLPDVLQRMHAATKAGGVGASLVMIGAMIARNVVHPAVGILTIAFLLLTLSVASQLLARAAYMSGAPIDGLERGDPLRGVLDRPDAAMEQQAADNGDHM